MISIDLRINSLPIELNRPYSKLIRSGKIKKIGFLAKKALKIDKGQTVYWVKNPTIDCFNSEFSIYPPIGVPGIAPKQMFGTSAYFYFNKSEVLIRVSFQLIDNPVLAKNGLQLFRNICGKTYHVRRTYGSVDDFIKIAEWEEIDCKLITELSDCGRHFYVHWFVK